jgi:hypothetical protein
VQEQKQKWELLNDDSSGDNALLAFKALEITGADFVVVVEKMLRYFSRLTREQKVDVMQSVKKHIRNVMVAIPEQKLERKSGSRKKKRPKKFDEHNAKMMLTKALLHEVFDADDWLEMTAYFAGTGSRAFSGGQPPARIDDLRERPDGQGQGVVCSTRTLERVGQLVPILSRVFTGTDDAKKVKAIIDRNGATVAPGGEEGYVDAMLAGFRTIVQRISGIAGESPVPSQVLGESVAAVLDGSLHACFASRAGQITMYTGGDYKAYIKQMTKIVNQQRVTYRWTDKQYEVFARAVRKMPASSLLFGSKSPLPSRASVREGTTRCVTVCLCSAVSAPVAACQPLT